MKNLRWMLLPLFWVACAHLPWSWPLAPAPELDAARIGAEVAWLADDAREGRGLGTGGLAAAADWLADGFEAAGLDTQLQRFEMPISIRVADAQLALNGQPLARGTDFEAFAGSADGDVTGELVFAGYGISDPASEYDDYAGLDVEGKVVLVLSHGPPSLAKRHGGHLGRPYKAVNAHRHGAAAVLLAPASARTEGLAGRPTEANRNPTIPAGNVPVLGLSRAAAERLVPDLAERRTRIDASGEPASLETGVRVRVRTHVERTRGEVANVVAVLRGTRADEGLVIGAHYDHLGFGQFDTLAPDRRGEVHNGADDNASGTAALLALARAFASGPAPDRSIVFVGFTAEEVGLVGSDHYAEHPAIPLDDTVAMLNLDMVGHLTADLVTVYGVETSPVWPDLVTRAAEPLGLRLQLVKDGLGPSDHTSFSARGVPALLFFTGVHDEYHTPDDDEVDADGIARVAQLVYRVAWSLANSPARPPARPAGATLQPSSGRGYGVYLGTIPAFGGEPVRGVRLQGVRDGSPAAKAGLRGGDVIVSFDGAEVANLEEYAALLFRAEPGSVVEIVVQRDGARVPLRATLGERR